MKITLFGLAGTGTSTVGKALAQKHNLKYGYTGQMFRDLAKEQGLSMEELDAKMRNNPLYDKEIDEKVKQFGEQEDNFIFEGRLAWYFIPNSLKIKFYCEEEEAMRRVAERENTSVEEAKAMTLKRADDIANRYKIIYPDLPYPPKDEVFDIIIDTTHIKPEEVILKIEKFLKEKNLL